VAAEILKESEVENPVDIDVADIIRTVHEQGCAMSAGTFDPRYVGIAAPVINWDEEICAVVTVIGRVMRDPGHQLATATQLRTFCRNMSAVIR
jgi:DNA-binding IclR family transcriptional regulator